MFGYLKKRRARLRADDFARGVAYALDTIDRIGTVNGIAKLEQDYDIGCTFDLTYFDRGIPHMLIEFNGVSPWITDL